MIHIEKDLKRQIAIKLQLIGDHYIDDYTTEQFMDNFSLLSGRGGSLLLQGILLKLTGDERYRKALLKTESFLISKINATDLLSPVFCDGMAGWGWLMLYLKAHGILKDFDDAVLEEVDDMLAVNLDLILKNGNFDLLYGAPGIGIYFLKRKKTAMVEKILHHLAENAVKEDDEIKWKQTRPVRSSIPRYDFGLPHGMTGIFYFINKCYRENVAPALCEEMLRKGINFFLNNIQDEKKAQSFFPYWIATDQYEDRKNNPTRSRLAWCYGDLSMLYTLLQLSRSVKDSALEDVVIKMLLHTCERRQPAETEFEGSGFCHGTSSLGYIYLKLFRQTKHPLFKETADYWYQQTCILGNEQGPAGYLFHSGLEQGVPVSSILEGLGGVMLAFVAYLYPDLEDNWDECLFLS